MSLGTRIKALRKSSKFTQQVLADKAGVSRIYIQALEGDRRTPSMKLLGIIAECLKVQPSDLVSSVAGQGGRFQLDEFLKGNSGNEIWHRGRKLTEEELGFVLKVIDAAVDQWQEKDTGKRGTKYIPVAERTKAAKGEIAKKGRPAKTTKPAKVTKVVKTRKAK